MTSTFRPTISNDGGSGSPRNAEHSHPRRVRFIGKLATKHECDVGLNESRDTRTIRTGLRLKQGLPQNAQEMGLVWYENQVSERSKCEVSTVKMNHLTVKHTKFHSNSLFCRSF